MAKKTVITLHGIRTRGVWQKELSSKLARYDMVPYPLDYGNVSAVSFLMPYIRSQKLDWFHKEYDRICSESVKRPSIIAHSFGTYLTAELICKYPEVKFDKIIFAGAIVKDNLDWPEIFRRGQVLRVRNEIATKDIWPEVARYAITGAGRAGSKGFSKEHPYISQDRYEIGHSGTFYEGHYEEWARYLCEPVFSPLDKKDIQDILAIAAQRAAQALSLPPCDVRANIFVQMGDKLGIPDGASFNMDGHPDLTIRIPVGMGATGQVFSDHKNRNPCIAIFNGNWGKVTLPPDELKKVHPDLKWIISLPLMDSINGQLLGIMNVDGIKQAISRGNFETPAAEELLGDLEFSMADAVSRKLCGLENGRI